MKEQIYPLALVDEIQQRLNLIRELFGGHAEPSIVIPSVPQKDVQEMEICRCILQLMDMNVPDHRGRMRPLFYKASHWQAVYRILVDYQLGAVDGDYIGFSNWMNRIIPDGCRVPFSYEALRGISRTVFVRPYAKWYYDSTYSQTRLPYESMVRIAEAFLQLLKDNGLVKC